MSQVPNGGPLGENEVYTPHRYQVLKKNFQAEQVASVLALNDAKKEWDNSEVKRQLLAAVPLQELKRRKFVPKGVTEHPWA